MFKAAFASVFALLLLGFISVATTISLAQNAQPEQTERLTNPPPAVTKSDDAAPKQSSQLIAYLTFKTPYEFWLTGLAIVVLIVMGAMLCFMAWSGSATSDFLRTYLLLVVVFAALFLIVAGYTDQQTAPVFSLLGSIAGYLFGRGISASPTTIGEGQQLAGEENQTKKTETIAGTGVSAETPKPSFPL